LNGEAGQTSRQFVEIRVIRGQKKKEYRFAGVSGDNAREYHSLRKWEYSEPRCIRIFFLNLRAGQLDGWMAGWLDSWMARWRDSKTASSP